MRVPVPEEILPADRLGRVHFVGIGGAGLSGIARIMLARGIAVSGSDGTDSPALQALRDLGARVHLGHDAAHVHDADTLVVSTAVREDNPEYVEARRQGLRLLPRSAALASVMAGRRVLAVAGTHGKTTTTSLLTVALQAAGADPTYAVGGDLAQTGTNAQEGSGRDFVAEADESDGAFLVYRPHAAIVTNVEADHLDNWGTEEAYRAAFAEFVDHLDPAAEGGFLVCVVDDDGARELAGLARARGVAVVGVGESADADLRAADLAFLGSTSTFTVHEGDRELGTITLQIPGRHYVLDALAALAVGLRLGHPFDALRRGLEGFTGTRRRMERKGEVAGVRVYDSYAHHPVEIAGDLQAARAVAGEGRVVVAFQPHLVSRTRIFGTAMGAALAAADEVVVLDVYLAREDADPAVTGALVADACPLPEGRVAFVPDFDAVPAELVARARPGDLVLTLGAGTVTQLGPRVLALLADAPGGAGGDGG
jgi:UDP-N-acetylmuramate--alanine ligase